MGKCLVLRNQRHEVHHGRRREKADEGHLPIPTPSFGVGCKTGVASCAGDGRERESTLCNCFRGSSRSRGTFVQTEGVAITAERFWPVEDARQSSKSNVPLLGAQPKKVEEKSVVNQLLSRVMTDPSQSMDASTLATLVQMELLRELKGKKKKSTHSYGSTELVASSDSDSSSGGDIRLRGAGKALKAYRKTQKDMKKNPARHVKRYIKEVEQVLGADASVPYLLTDYTRKLGWGKFRTLQRLHHALSAILETQLKGKTMEATLQITQVLRSIHQCALDQGNWQTAWLLTGMQDPLEKPRFGGEAQSLEAIAAYIKAMDDLEKRSTSSSASRSQEEDAPAGAKGNKKGKKGQKADAEPVG